MIKIATFDIETTHLAADFGIILCAVIKAHEKSAKAIVLRADELNPDWDKRRSNDKAIVHQLRRELEQFDVLVAHNGLRFDLPFLRTRLARWNLAPLRDIKLIDPCRISRNKLRMSYNSLDKIGAFLGVNSKTPVSGELWVKAALDGDRRAMNYIVEHCVEDVETLTNIVDAVKPYSTAFDSWGSGR